MKKFIHLLLTIEKRLAEIIMIFIVFFVFIAAALRWFNHPLVWSEDLAKLLFVWVCFIGADVALQNNKHIGIDALFNKLPLKTQKIITISTYITIIIFVGIVAIYGAKLAYSNYHRQFSGMEFSYSWATASAPVGCILMIRTLIAKLYGILKN